VVLDQEQQLPDGFLKKHMRANFIVPKMTGDD
jgi:hypothetical protein